MFSFFKKNKKQLTSTRDHNLKWAKNWEGNEEFIHDRKRKFQILKNYLVQPPGSLLEIGCGLALESELFQKEFGTELNFIEGDVASNTESKKRDVGFDDAGSMQFYLTFDYLKSHWNSRELKYNLIDANNIYIPAEKKFDLIYSLKSCGFHYPLNIYFDLIKKHSHENTKLIFEIRDSAIDDLKPYVEFLNEILRHEKSAIYELKIL